MTFHDEGLFFKSANLKHASEQVDGSIRALYFFSTSSHSVSFFYKQPFSSLLALLLRTSSLLFVPFGPL